MAERTTAPKEQVLYCHAGALTDPDLGTVEVLAHLQLVARRHGIAVRLCHVPPPLEELLVLAGLTEGVLGCLCTEPSGKPEEGKEPGGIEEGVHRHDPPA